MTATTPVTSTLANTGYSAKVLPLYAEESHAYATLRNDGSQFVVTAGEKANKATGRESWSRSVVVDSFAPSIASLGNWATLVNLQLAATAEDVLREYFVSTNRVANTIPADLFSVDSLKIRAMIALSGNMTEDQLREAFTKSHTWQTIINGEKYKGSEAARSMAGMFFSKVLLLSGRSLAGLDEETLDIIQARLADEDLQTGLGMFVTKRIEHFRIKLQEDNGKLQADAF